MPVIKNKARRAESNALSENRRAKFDYEILSTYEAGVELSGQEVKSVKNGQGNLAGSYAIIRGGEVWLINTTIPPYQTNNAPTEYEPSRTRRLLLTKEEIRELASKLNEKGLSLIALHFFLRNGFIKLAIGLGRARKKQDKRDLLKKRDTEREMKK